MDERTNTHGNSVHRDRRRHAVSTSLRLVTNGRIRGVCLSVRLRWSLTLCGLQILSAACSEELTRLEMQINEKRRYACGLVHALAHYLNNFGIILFV